MKEKTRGSRWRLASRLAATSRAPLPSEAARASEGRVHERGLHGQDEDGPDVLEDEDAQGHAPGLGHELVLVVEQLDHDHRAGEGQAHAGVGSVEPTVAEGEAGAHRQRGPEERAQRGLEQAGQDQGTARAQELLQVHLQADDEEEQDEADLGDEGDGLAVADETEPQLRPHRHPRQEVGEDQRLLAATVR